MHPERPAVRKNERRQVEACLLLDFYGAMLTDHSRSVLEGYYAEDLSLAELAARHQVSRQAVHDCLCGGISSLDEYENRLGLIRRFRSHQALIDQIIDDLDSGRCEQARSRLAELKRQL